MVQILKRKSNIFLKWLLIAILALVTFAAFGFKANAAQGPMIAVKPNYNANQIKKNGVIFVKTKPGQNQKISINIANISKAPQKVKVYATTAFTSNGGSIALNPTNKFPYDKSLKHKFSDLTANKPREYDIPGQKTVNVSYDVKAPNNPYSGLIMGGIYVQPLLQNGNAGIKGVGFNNRFALAMPVYLRDHTSLSIFPELTAQKIEPNKLQSQTVIQTKLANEKPTTINQMSLKDKIYHKNQPNKVISRFKQDGMSMAPNSNFTLTNNLNNNALTPGDYHLSLQAKAAGGQHWNIQKDFHISAAQAAIYNGNKNWWWLLLLFALLILIIALCYVLYRQHKKQKQILEQQAEINKNLGSHGSGSEPKK